MKHISLAASVLTAAFVIGCGGDGGNGGSSTSSGSSSSNPVSTSASSESNTSSTSDAISSWPALDATVDNLTALTLDEAVSYFGSVEENTEFVTSITANQPVAFSISATGITPEDGTRFEMVSVSEQVAELHFSTAPNYEAPTDSDSNNVYNVSVRAEAQDGADITFDIAVTVTDRGVPKTGQTVSHNEFFNTGSDVVILYKDDGYYQKGIERNFEQNATNPLLIIDHAQDVQWSNDHPKRIAADAVSYCADANFQGLTGWRLPSTQELFYMATKADFDPAVEAPFTTFSSTPYWSADVWLENGDYRWSIDFNEGNITRRTLQSGQNYFTCVNGDPIEYDRARMAEDSVVIDTRTDLMWQDNDDSNAHVVTWFEGIQYCEYLEFAGFNDWRMPNINELVSIVDYSRSDPALPEVFEQRWSLEYWSSTGDIRSQYDRAWRVDFNDGSTPRVNKYDNNAYVRCVRDY